MRRRRWSWQQSRGRKRAGDSKLLNHRSDLQSNSARCFNGNSVIDDNLKLVWTVDNNIPITLIFVTFNCETNFGELGVLFVVPFKTLALMSFLCAGFGYQTYWVGYQYYHDNCFAVGLNFLQQWWTLCQLVICPVFRHICQFSSSFLRVSSLVFI